MAAQSACTHYRKRAQELAATRPDNSKHCPTSYAKILRPGVYYSRLARSAVVFSVQLPGHRALGQPMRKRTLTCRARRHASQSTTRDIAGPDGRLLDQRTARAFMVGRSSRPQIEITRIISALNQLLLVAEYSCSIPWIRANHVSASSNATKPCVLPVAVISIKSTSNFG